MDATKTASESFCYVLRCDTAKTYAGYTVDPARRLRQHNGQIQGGAWCTKSRPGAWSFAFVVASAGFDRHLALSFEWHLKHPPKGTQCWKQGKKKTHKKKTRAQWEASRETLQRGLALRLTCLRNAMGLPKFAACAPTMVVYAAPDLVDDVWAAVCDANDHVCVMSLEDAPMLGGLRCGMV